MTCELFFTKKKKKKNYDKFQLYPFPTKKQKKKKTKNWKVACIVKGLVVQATPVMG
jgi:hypothetical protein